MLPLRRAYIRNNVYTSGIRTLTLLFSLRYYMLRAMLSMLRAATRHDAAFDISLCQLSLFSCVTSAV